MDIKSIIISVVLLAVGLAAGIVLTQQDARTGGLTTINPTVFESSVSYKEPVITTSSDLTLLGFQSGSTIYATASGSTTTLPAVTSGATFRFVVGAALDTVNWIIDSAEGDNIDGTLIVAGAVVDCRGEDQINFVVDGEQVGDFVELRSNGSQWFIGDSGGLTAAKITCTDPN